MRGLIGTELLRKLPRQDIDIRDTKLQGFVLRCRATGSHAYRVNLGRGVWQTLGKVGELTPAEAREQARGLLGDAAKDRANGRDPIAERKRKKAATKGTIALRAFLAEHYDPWLLEHHKRGKETAQRLRAVFVDLLDTKLADLNAWTIEKWRTARLKAPHAKPSTVNSHLTMLKAALGRAVAWGLLPAHPLADVKPLKADKTGRVRYLSAGEETRLREALDARDETRRKRRAAANAWRRERGYAEWPADGAGHLTPIVRLAINSGMRKGEIFNLRWPDVDLDRALATVRGEGIGEEGAKSKQTRYLPLNSDAVTALRAWQSHAGDLSGYVFPGRAAGERLDDVKKGWAPVVKAAQLVNFTFHDLRHTFASKLVMAGVDLNTVRELLGHADLKMTLRYAHLAPEHKAAAVAKLVHA